MKEFLKIIGLPVILLGIFLSLWAIWQLLDLPSRDELIEIAKRYFTVYGSWAVFISAVIEGMLLVGWYYPGSLVILLGLISAGDSVARLALIVIVGTAGLLLAYLFNYGLGKYGWYKILFKFGLQQPLEHAQQQLTKYGLSGIFLSYWGANLAVFTSTAAGILQFPFKTFILYSIIAATLWDTMWGVTVYYFGETVLEVIGIRFVVVVIAIWVIYRLLFRRKHVTLKML